ncbi:MAG: Hsp70 family protein, partial [Acidimicrobiales bacterium]|nr:Hsp70 family protein [Acidimicrobiales bacterium]
MTGWTLAIDVGTSRTAGAAAEGDRVVPLEIEGNRWMSSTVAVADDDSIVVGRAALAVASARPDRAERSPKRNVGSPVPMVLGERAVSTAEAFAALMTAVADEAKRRFDGAQPSRLALTHPVRWEEARQEVLIEAAALAGLPEPVLVPEPVAAALHYAAGDLSPGDQIAVYDLGGGTFDTVVMRRTDDGFEVMGPPGGDESIGGDHFDHLVFLHLGSMLAAHDAELWQNMLVGTDRKWMRAAFDLLTEARNVKENLSLYPSTQIYVPAADRELLMTRAELEALIENPIERSVEELADTILDADVDEDDIKAIYLVGGSSRIPMVYDRLVARFGDKVRTRDEPKSVVVEGAARLAAGHLVGPGASRQATATDDGSTPLPAGGELTGPPQVCGGGENLVLWDDRSVWIVAEGHSTRLESSHPVVSALPTRAGAVTLTTDGMLSSYDGEVQRWSTAPPFEVAVGPVSAGDATLVADRAGQLASFDHRGSMSWMLPVGHSVSAIAASASVVVLSTLEGRAICIDAMTGRVRWIYPTRDRIEGPALLGGRLLHVTSADSILYSLDVDTGRPAWAYRLDAPSPAPVLAGDLVVVSGAADVVGLDRSSGAERWRLPIA